MKLKNIIGDAMGGDKTVDKKKYVKEEMQKYMQQNGYIVEIPGTY